MQHGLDPAGGESIRYVTRQAGHRGHPVGGVGDHGKTAFAKLARKHRVTPMIGRTLMQPATPLAFGQKVAGWASDIDRATRRFEESFAETQILQFGGASGSLSALGRKAEPVMKALAKRLGLALPPAPWFAQRVRVAAFAQDAALVTGALGKAGLLSGRK